MNIDGSKNTGAMSGFLAAFIFFLGLVFGTPARADEYHNAAAAYCNPQKNQFLIRFGGYYNDDPPQTGEYGRYPNEVPKELLDKAIWGKNSCVLSNGQHIQFRREDGFASGFGPGGAMPNLVLFMTINNKKVYNKYDYYPAGQSNDPYVSSIYYDGLKLVQCDMVYQEGEFYPMDRTKMICHDVSARLEEKIRDKSEIEYEEYIKKFNSYKTINKNIDICKIVDVYGPPAYLKNRFDYENNNLLYDFERENNFSIYKNEKCFDHIVYGEYDLDEDGIRNPMYVFDANYGWFDGSFIIYSKSSGKNVERNFVNYFCKDKDFERAVYDLPKNKSDFVVITDPDQDLRYTSVKPYVINGHTYFLLARKGEFRLPLATLVSMSKDGKMNTICTFK